MTRDRRELVWITWLSLGCTVGALAIFIAALVGWIH